MEASVKKFVVVGTQRTGTTLVTTSLNSHPAIHCAGELFKMRRPHGSVDVLDSGYRAYIDTALHLRVADFFFRGRLVPAFLDRFFEQPGFKAVGFKLMNNHTYPREFASLIPYLIRRHISVIHMVRDNVLKTHLSRLAAQRRRVFHATKKPTDLPKLNVSTVDLELKLSRIEAQGTRLKQLFQGNVPYVAVTYEGYIADSEKEVQRLLSFLGVPSAPLRSPLVKVSPEDLSQIVENLDDVRRCLDGTRYSKWVT